MHDKVINKLGPSRRIHLLLVIAPE